MLRGLGLAGQTRPSQYARKRAPAFSVTSLSSYPDFIPLEIIARSIDHFRLAVTSTKACSARCFQLIPAVGIWACFCHSAHLSLWSECLCYSNHCSSRSYCSKKTATKTERSKSKNPDRIIGLPLSLCPVSGPLSSSLQAASSPA